MNKRKIVEFDLIQNIRRYFSIMPYQPIIPWCEKNIDFSDDVSAERNKLDFDLYPYQIPILQHWENKQKTIKTITVVAPEQVGKTAMFVCGLLWNMVFNPCQSLIVYPNDQQAIGTNQTKFLPLMKHIPVLRQQLKNKRSYSRERYFFSNLISYFQGAGIKIVSKSCKIVIGDEVQAWPTIHGVDNVRDLKKRTRSYNNSVCFLISTPKFEDGKIWKSFEEGSRGYWWLRCKGCGQLTMRSCDVHNLQFENELDEASGQRIIKEESIRLICPKCGYQHVEADKKWMNIHGQFIHQVPQRLKENPSFQIGGLASQLPAMSWKRIAEQQFKAGKRADIDAHQHFDNSIRGLPYKRRQVVKEDLEKIRDHQYQGKECLKPEQIQFVFSTFDTMDQYFRYGIFASDIYDNIHVIKFGETKYLSLEQSQRDMINNLAKEQAYKAGTKYQPVETVEQIMDKEYYGFLPLINVIDSRGHRTKQIQQFVLTHPRAAGWYGGKVLSEKKHYKKSEIQRSFLVSAQHYKVEAIYFLHTWKKRDMQYLYFYKNVQQKFVDEIAAMHPDYNRKSGHIPENWTSQEKADHTFDCLKMAFFARDFCIDKQNFKKERFNFCKSPRLKRQYQDLIKQDVQKVKSQVKSNNKTWIGNPNGKNPWFKI